MKHTTMERSASNLQQQTEQAMPPSTGEHDNTRAAPFAVHVLPNSFC
jgi:hypothetical protein